MIQAKGIKIEENKNAMTVAYVDDIVLLAETDNDLKNTVNSLLKEGGKIGLKIKETKTKYMIFSRLNHRLNFLKVNYFKFVRVKYFKYLGTNTNEESNNHEEVKR